jgi:hypothetical protein
VSIERVKEICAALPECEVAGSQHHKLTVNGKTMGWHTVDHHGDGRVSLSIKAPKGENRLRSESEPDRFFMPSYVAQHGYVGVYLDTDDVDWGEVEDLIVQAYRLVAPKRLLKALDATS